MADPILSWLESRREEMLSLLQQLVEHESPSTNKTAVDGLGKKLARELEVSGATVRIIEAGEFGNHLLAEVAGKEQDAQILVIGHMDTVWDVGTLDDMPFRIEEGRCHGPGVFDMKAGLVQVLFAVRALRETGRESSARVVILINSDEEMGSPSSRPLIEEQARGSRAAFVLEPSLSPDGRLKTFRKGGGVFRLSVQGRAAHAGLDPRAGVSAVEELARQIVALHAMTDYERGITVNVGTIQGGTRVNVIAAEAFAEIDVRVSTMADARTMEARILGLQPYLEGVEVVVSGGIDRPPLERSPGVVSLYETARRISNELGFELDEGPAGGGSDGNLTAAQGTPTLDGLGAVGDGAHAAHEHVLVAEIPRRAALLARLLEIV
jgi:glutamate carboxypeptidase